MYTDNSSNYSQSPLSYSDATTSADVREVLRQDSAARLVSGMRVLIISGPLEGLRGIVTSAPSADRWLVRLPDAGCYVEISGSQIVAAPVNGGAS